MKEKLMEPQEENHSGLVVFSFYSSFWEAGKHLKDKDRLEFYDAILNYCFLGKEPELSGVLAAVFAVTRPNIDASNRRRLAGSVGGKSTSKKSEEVKEQGLEKKEKKSSSCSASAKSASKGKEKSKEKENVKKTGNKKQNANEAVSIYQEQELQANGEAQPPRLHQPPSTTEVSLPSTATPVHLPSTTTPVHTPKSSSESNYIPTPQTQPYSNLPLIGNPNFSSTTMSYGTPPPYVSPYHVSTPDVDYISSSNQVEADFSPQEEAMIEQHIAEVEQQYHGTYPLPPLSEPVVIQERLPIQDNQVYEITYSQLNSWSEQYPNVDIQGELTKMKHWLSSHSPQGRTQEKAKNFVQKWLREEEEKAVHKQKLC